MPTPITVNHPQLGQCKIIERSPTSTYIEMPSGRRFTIPKNEPERTRAINLVQEVEKEPLLCDLLPNSQ